MICSCRHCGKEYENSKARGDWTGYCSARCQHAKAKALGYRKGGSEYDVLKRCHAIGDVPVEAERVPLRAELKELRASRYGSPSRIDTIERLLKTKLK